MKLFLVHCGFYSSDVGDGIYESHVNFFVAAEDFSDARTKAKNLEDFKKFRMHVDGIQELRAVDGFRISLEADSAFEGRSEIVSHRHRDLAAKPTPTA